MAPCCHQSLFASMTLTGMLRAMEPTLTKLNLGCGQYPKTGYINVDKIYAPGVDLTHDLEVIPYPFESQQFHLIEADHLIEHLSDVFSTMRELHRLLTPGGELVLRMPHFSRGFSHPAHRRGFDATFPYYFNPQFPGGYSGTHFQCILVKLHWFAQPYLKRSVLNLPLFLAGKAIGSLINVLANLWPIFCSRIWCYYVGGFEEIEFVFRKPVESDETVSVRG
jgi:SAM-dependent methyltransferase